MASVPCHGPWQGRTGQGGSHPTGHRSPPRGVVFVKHILLCKPQETLRANSGCPLCGKLQPTQLWVPSSSWLWVCTPLSYHRQWWIKVCVPYNNTKLSTYSKFIQPLDMRGVDLIIQQFGYFPQIASGMYLIPSQPPRDFIGFLTFLMSCILAPEGAVGNSMWPSAELSGLVGLPAPWVPDAVPVIQIWGSAHVTSAEVLRLTQRQCGTPTF